MVLPRTPNAETASAAVARAQCNTYRLRDFFHKFRRVRLSSFNCKTIVLYFFFRYLRMNSWHHHVQLWPTAWEIDLRLPPSSIWAAASQKMVFVVWLNGKMMGKKSQQFLDLFFLLQFWTKSTISSFCSGTNFCASSSGATHLESCDISSPRTCRGAVFLRRFLGLWSGHPTPKCSKLF